MIQLLLMVFLVNAAPKHPDYPMDVHKETIRYLIQTPDSSADIKRLGPEAYKQLRAIMFAPEEKMEHRWNATLTLAKIGGFDSLPDIDKALSNSAWFMRSAGLLATSIVDKKRAVEKAKVLMHEDAALMVRASALQVIAQDAKVERAFLWAELNNPKNFNNGKGLSIRQSILKVLSENVAKSESTKFIALMREDDPEIKRLAGISLKSIYKK